MCAACPRPRLRKSTLSRQAAPLLPQPHQAPARQRAAAWRGGANQPRISWQPPPAPTWQGRLFYGGIMLLCSLVAYLCAFPFEAGLILGLAMVVMLHA